MKETGLMFKAPLVRSILEGSKTQTRRVVKLPHTNPLGEWEALQLGGPDGGRTSAGATMPAQMGIGHTRTGEILTSPYGGPGDRIYVRETFAHGIHAMAAAREEDGPFVYAADGTTEGRLGNKWTPCLLMPKYAARIWLEITGVRVERLQDISEADCIAEGISELPHQAAERGCWWTGNVAAGAALHGRTPRNAFQLLWESTGGDWAANPWCWVIDFKRIHDHKATP